LIHLATIGGATVCDFPARNQSEYREQRNHRCSYFRHGT
jgi:hypothetical protein